MLSKHWKTERDEEDKNMADSLRLSDVLKAKPLDNAESESIS